MARPLVITYASISYWLSGSGPCVWIFPRSERNGRFFSTTGTLTGLLLAYLERSTPVGIVLDRMEECPEEVQDAGTELVLATVEWLRKQHPTGV